MQTADWRAVVGLVTGGHFLSHFYLLAFPPLFPLLRADLGLSNTQLGLLMSALAVGTLLQLPLGEVVDRVGAKAVFVGGTAVTAAGIVAAGAGVRSYPLLLGAALLSGLGQAAFHPADYALIEAAASAEFEGRSFGVHTFGGYAGFAAAPVVVGGLALATGPGVALGAVGAVGLAYAAVAAVALAPVYREQMGEKRDEAESTDLRASLRGLRADLLRPSVLALFAFFAVLTMAGKGVQTFTTVLVAEAYGFGESVANAALTAFSAAAAGGVLAGGLLADRFRPRRVILATLATGGVATWVVVGEAAALGPAASVAGFGAVGLVTGLAYPSRDRLVSRVTASGSTGRGFGFVFTGISLGGLASPALLGRVVDLATAPAAFALVGGFYLLAAGVATRLGGE